MKQYTINRIINTDLAAKTFYQSKNIQIILQNIRYAIRYQIVVYSKHIKYG